MNSTVPLLVGFVRPENSSDNTGSDFVVGAWIPDSFQNRAPAPGEDAEIKVQRFSRESYFVANWTGAPAVAGTVAKKADELSEALDENKVCFFVFFRFPLPLLLVKVASPPPLTPSFSPSLLTTLGIIPPKKQEHYHKKMAWMMSYR